MSCPICMDQLTNENRIISCWKEHALCEDCHREQIRPRLVISSYADNHAERLNNGCPECREPMFDWFGITGETVDAVDEWYDCFKDRCPFREIVTKMIMRRFMREEAGVGDWSVAAGVTPTQMTEWALRYFQRMVSYGVTDDCNGDLSWMNEEEVGYLHEDGDVAALSRYLSWGGANTSWETECEIAYDLSKHIFGLEWWLKTWIMDDGDATQIEGTAAMIWDAKRLALKFDSCYSTVTQQLNQADIERLLVLNPTYNLNDGDGLGGFYSRATTSGVLPPKPARRCSICRGLGHNRRTCPQR